MLITRFAVRIFGFGMRRRRAIARRVKKPLSNGLPPTRQTAILHVRRMEALVRSSLSSARLGAGVDCGGGGGGVTISTRQRAGVDGTDKRKCGLNSVGPSG